MYMHIYGMSRYLILRFTYIRVYIVATQYVWGFSQNSWHRISISTAGLQADILLFYICRQWMAMAYQKNRIRTLVIWPFYNFDVVNDSLKNAFSVAIELNFQSTHGKTTLKLYTVSHEKLSVDIKDYVNRSSYLFHASSFRFSCWIGAEFLLFYFHVKLNSPKSICLIVRNSR